MYSPTLGRWMQMDPSGYVDGMNPYQFVRSNPETWTDPLGLKGKEGSAPDAKKDNCKCKGIDLRFGPDKPVWTVYEDGDELRIGFQIKTTFTVEGNAKAGEYGQDEGGELITSSPTGYFADRKWADQHVGTVKGGRGNKIIPGKNATFDKSGTGTYIDLLGTPFPTNKGTGSFVVELSGFTVQTWCKSSDGSVIKSKKYRISGKVTVQVTVTGQGTKGVKLTPQQEIQVELIDD